MISVFKREFRAMFCAVRGYAASAILVLVSGFLVVYYGFLAEMPSIAYILSDLMLVSALACTVLCLGIFGKNDALLRTLPVSSFDIALGKYLALLSVYAIQVAFLAFVPFIYNYFGKVDFADSYLSLLAYFLFLASVVSVDLFLFARIKKRTLAIIASVGYIVFMYLLQVLNLFLSRGDILGGALSKIVFFVGAFSRFEPFIYGEFDISTLVYYLSITVFFLFLTVRILEKKRGEGREI